jgi:hypothetical protein
MAKNCKFDAKNHKKFKYDAKTPNGLIIKKCNLQFSYIFVGHFALLDPDLIPNADPDFTTLIDPALFPYLLFG